MKTYANSNGILLILDDPEDKVYTIPCLAWTPPLLFREITYIIMTSDLMQVFCFDI